MNKPKMLPCPHCGNEFPLMTPNAAYGYKIRCEQCHTEFALDCTAGRNFDHDKTVDAWNRRAPLPDNKALTVEELREAADCGIPVWLVGVGSKDQWVRIDYVESLTIGFSAFCDAETWSFCAERYGKTVFAYRRPPEKGE